MTRNGPNNSTAKLIPNICSVVIVPGDADDDAGFDDDNDDELSLQSLSMSIFLSILVVVVVEIRPTEQVTSKPTKRIVGTLKRLQSGTVLLTSSNK